MAKNKPTVFQSILGRPSQSYSFPPQKPDYHSSKAALLTTASRPPRDRGDLSGDAVKGPVVDVVVNGEAREFVEDRPANATKHCDNDNDSGSNDDDNDDKDIFYTPNASPHTSMYIDDHMSITSTADSIFSAKLSASTPLTSHSGRSHGTYTDDDWAKEVRWLVPPNTTSLKRRATQPAQPMPSPHYFPPRPLPRRAKTTNYRHQKQKPGIVMSMSALLEEDEESDLSPRKSATNIRVRSTSSPTTPPPHISRLSRQRPLPQHHPASYSSVSSNTVLLPNPIPASSSSSWTPDLPSSGTAGYTTLTLPRAAYTPGHGIGKLDLTRAGIAQTTMATIEIVRGVAGHHSTNSRGLSLGALGLSNLASLSPGGERKRRVSLGSISAVKLGLRFKQRKDLGAVFASPFGTSSSPSPSSGSGSRSPASSQTHSRSASTASTPRSLHSVVPPPQSTPKYTSPLTLTSHRAPPAHVPAGSVLVQVWALAVDGVDAHIVYTKGGETDVQAEVGRRGRMWQRSVDGGVKESGKVKGKAEVGFIPGRSFVGRVLECGWEVREEVVRKGEWVIGLLDVRKCGACAEFIVVDRHRIHRVPHPKMDNQAPSPSTNARAQSQKGLYTSPRIPASSDPRYLTLEELALLPLVGVPAYRAIRTLPSPHAPSPPSAALSIHIPSSNARPRVLVLGGHAGAGALAVQVLAQRGWRVCVGAPLPSRSGLQRRGRGQGWSRAEEAEALERAEEALEERVLAWGAEDVFFDEGESEVLEWDGEMTGLVERLRSAGETFDAVLDTVGGRAVWEACERLLGSMGSNGEKGRADADRRQFTTLVGDTPGRPVPSARDHFRAGLRSMGVSGKEKDKDGAVGKGKNKSKSKKTGRSGAEKPAGTPVAYAWVRVASDVDWEGSDVRDTLGAVLQLVQEGGVRPFVGAPIEYDSVGPRDDDEEDNPEGEEVVMPFEQATEAFIPDGAVWHGGTVVVRVVG